MKIIIGFVLISIIIISCNTETAKQTSPTTANPIVGTWKLVTGTLIEKGDTTSTDYTKNTSFIKIINDTHFSFLQHDLSKGKDSAPVFVAGGGKYSLTESSYTEHLEYSSAREWEGNDFTFNVTIKGDTLVQSGIEKVESAGIDRVNIEKYVKVKK
jgi:hypothetical protein